MPAQIKAAGELGSVGAASKQNFKPNRSDSKQRKQVRFFDVIARRLWVAEYALEEARQSHERHGRHFRRLICCAGFAMLQLLAGGRHV